MMALMFNPMLSTAHFQNLPAVICRHLADARQHIRIAVCWFSHRDIFEVILQKLRAGIGVDLILEYDAQNIRSEGLPFQKFIQLGGNLYAYRDAALMHHKFALIDDALLLTGSYNWTYARHAENLLSTNDPALLVAYRDEFHRLKALSMPIRKIRPAEVKPFATIPQFQNARVDLAGLRRMISSGAGVWWVRAGRQAAAWAEPLRRHILPLDPDGLLRPYWACCPVWDEVLFDQCWPALQAAAPAAAARSVRLLARRIRPGDVVLALAGRQQVIAIGVVQSEPIAAAESDWSAYREIRWVRVLTDAPVRLPKPVSPGRAGRFRGSGLALLQEVWERGGQFGEMPLVY